MWASKPRYPTWAMGSSILYLGGIPPQTTLVGNPGSYSISVSVPWCNDRSSCICEMMLPSHHAYITKYSTAKGNLEGFKVIPHALNLKKSISISSRLQTCYVTRGMCLDLPGTPKLS